MSIEIYLDNWFIFMVLTTVVTGMLEVDKPFLTHNLVTSQEIFSYWHKDNFPLDIAKDSFDLVSL